MIKQLVEMHLAYVWDCENCGTENFERAIVYEFSPDELAEIADEENPELSKTGNWMTHPARVKCKACNAEFEARHFRDADGPNVGSQE